MNTKYKILYAPREYDAEIENMFLDWEEHGIYPDFYQAMFALMRLIEDDYFNNYRHYAYRIVEVEK